MAGHYEVHDYPAAGHGLKVIVWAEPGKAPLVMTTISPEPSSPGLADALNKHLAGQPGRGLTTPPAATPTRPSPAIGRILSSAPR